jgi:hypothetical protein
MLQKVEQPNGYLIRVFVAANTADPYAPSIYQATWSVGWSPENIDLDTSIIQAQDPTGGTLNSSSSTPYTSIRFTFSGTDNVDGSVVEVKEFECTLDGYLSPCTGDKIRYDQINPGTHTFQVSAKDAAGVLDKTPATFTWTVEEQDFPPICRTRPDLPQCDPAQSQTQELPSSEESFPGTTQQPPSEGDNTSSSISSGDGSTEEGGSTTTTGTDPTTIDQDFDGYSPSTGDCDDSNPNAYPSATEVDANGIDEDCDGFDGTLVEEME